MKPRPISLAAVLAAYTDDTRLLALHLDAGEPPAAALVVQRLRGREALSECGAFELECLALEAGIEAKALLGRRAGVRLAGAAGGARWFNGIVTRVAPHAADGGRRRYALTVRPALALLGLARSTWIHQERTVPDILDAELARWQAKLPDLQWRFELRARYPVRSYTALYGETPLAFLERLCAEEGIGYRFEHLAPEGEGVGDARVVFFDDSPSLPMNAQATTRFHRADVTEADDTVDRWAGERAIVPGAVALASWEYKDARIHATHVPTLHAHGAASALAAALEDYAPQTQYYGSGGADLERYARLRMEAYEAQAKLRRGAGAVRSFVPGTATELTGHFEDGGEQGAEARTHLLVAVEHDARNNLPAELRGAGEAFEPGYRNRFTAIRHAVPWRPGFDHTRHAKPTARGLQTARVAGAEGREIDVDAYGRVLVHFHWDREGRNSCRLRVAGMLAGKEWGMQTLPRIGQEVLVGYLEDDIDRPMVMGAVHNGAHRPPRFSGAGSLPANHALSGIQTRELGGGRGYGELLFDDTRGQIRTRLSSEHAHTELNQGWLATARTEGRAEPRGEGFELRTDAAGALRGAHGLLISAFARLRADGKQLAREETARLMEECLTLFRQLGEYAAQHAGAPTDAAPHARLQEDFVQWEHGSNTAPQAAPAGGAPIVTVTAPAGVHLSSPESVVTHAGRTVDTVALEHLQFSSGARTTVNAGAGLSLFAQSGGVSAIAHQGPLRLQSQHDHTTINAAQDLTLTASGGRIHAMAADEIVLAVSGGAYLKLSGANVEIGCPGTVAVKAASHAWGGPASSATELPAFGSADLGRSARLVRATDGAPLADQPFEIFKSDGSVASGRTGADGRATPLSGDTFEHLAARFLPTED